MQLYELCITDSAKQVLHKSRDSRVKLCQCGTRDPGMTGNLSVNFCVTLDTPQDLQVSSDISWSHSPKSRGEQQRGCLGCQQRADASTASPSPASSAREELLLWGVSLSPDTCSWSCQQESKSGAPSLLFSQSLKMFQKTGPKLNLTTCASFYPWTSGLKSSWCSII